MAIIFLMDIGKYVMPAYFSAAHNSGAKVASWVMLGGTISNCVKINELIVGNVMKRYG